MSHIHPSAPKAVAACTASSGGAPAPAFAAPPVTTRASRPLYSIRLSERPGTPCALCLEPTGAGPVGHLDEEAVCDRCLLESCIDLGMVLALVAVTREYAVVEDAPDEERAEGLAELGAFARIYERIAQRSGPRRTFQLSDPEDDPVH